MALNRIHVTGDDLFKILVLGGVEKHRQQIPTEVPRPASKMRHGEINTSYLPYEFRLGQGKIENHFLLTNPV